MKVCAPFALVLTAFFAGAEPQNLQTFIDGKIASGAKEIVIPAGRHKMVPKNGSHLCIRGVKDVVIIAEGAELVCTEAANALTVTNCSNLTIRGLTIDYDPLPFSEGRVVKVFAEKAEAEVELFEGYPEADAINLFKCQFFDPQTKWLCSAQTPRSLKVLDKRRLKLTWGSKNAVLPDIGDVFVSNVNLPLFSDFFKNPDAYSMSYHAVRQQNCVRTRFEKVSVFGSHWFSFYERDCDGTVYDRCTVDRRSEQSDPMKRGFPRLRASNSDAFHITRAAKGPEFLACTARYMEDDGINIHGFYHLVSASDGNALRVFSQAGMNIAPGDTVELLTFDGVRLPDSKVIACVPDVPSRITGEETEFLRNLNCRPYFSKHWDPDVYKITLDRKVELQRGAVIVSLNHTGRGFKIKDCTIGYTRARGLLVRASDGMIESNTISDTFLPAVKLASEAWWLEGGNPDNITIAGNRLSRSREQAIILEGAGGLAGGKAKTGVSRNISILNNTITDCRIPAIQLCSARNVKLRDNRCYVDVIPDKAYVDYPDTEGIEQAYNRYYTRRYELPPPGAVPACDAATLNKKRFVSYRSFNKELEMTKTFADMGITTRCFFAANAINSLGTPYCQYPLIWTGLNQYNFEAFDQQVGDLLKASPQADFLCMIDFNTPYWLTRRFALDSFADISHIAANMEWRKLTMDYVKAFVTYAEKKYGDKISAYILSGGGTSEWYEYDRGRSSRDKNTAWRDWCREKRLAFGEGAPSETELFKAAHENVVYDPATEAEKIAYWQFHNETITDAILFFAKGTRRFVPKDKEIGLFFGYYLVSDSKLVSFGHLDYERVFSSPDIDFVIAPGAYSDRMMGAGSGSQLVHGTALRYGKQFLHEIDYWTHCKAKNYWHTQADDIAGCTREAAFSMINHTSHWWFDMWGGFYQEAPTRDRIKLMNDLTRKYWDDRSPSAAEVLYVADPQSAYYLNERASQVPKLSEKFRNKLNRIGAPFDVYSFNDLAAIKLSQYKIIFMPGTFLITPEREKILREKVLRDGRFVVWAYAPGICDGKTLETARVKKWSGVEYKHPGVSITRMEDWHAVYSYDYDSFTPAEIQSLCKKAGVHIFIEDLVPVYANTRHFCIHLKEGGEKRIRLPVKAKRVSSLLDGKIVGENVDSFTFNFASPDTQIFEIE